jgi:hypothetical protein
MKTNKTNTPKQSKPRKNAAPGATRIVGADTNAKDAPEHDEHHDESRRNMFDPEVAEALQGTSKKSRSKE